MTSGTAPTLSRQHAGGAPGARAWLMTVLGELVLPTGGDAWTASLVDVMNRVGVEEKATRQAILRTADAGWLHSERRGRSTRWSLTPAGSALLTAGAERIYGSAADDPEWDGRWLMVLARTTDAERRHRHVLRSRLSWAGLGPLGPGTWISPRPDAQTEVEAVLARAEVSDAHCFVARHSFGDEARMVGEAWDVPAIALEYGAFVDTFRPPSGHGDLLGRQIRLVHRWRRFPQLAPTLPRRLLPPRWTGDEATGLFRRRHDAWWEPALSAWRELDAR